MLRYAHQLVVNLVCAPFDVGRVVYLRFCLVWLEMLLIQAGRMNKPKHELEDAKVEGTADLSNPLRVCLCE